MKHKLTAKRIQLALSNANMKPQELANLSGVKKASISQYVNGSHVPGNINAGKMGAVLNVNPLWLMGFDAPMERKNNSTKAEKDFDILYKFSMLNERDKKIVSDMIDSMLSGQEEGA